MMEAKDLRIGNCVLDRGNRLLIIDWFEKTKVCQRMVIQTSEVHPLTEHFCKLKPIPLTKEWLIKFGFKPNSNDVYETSKTEMPLSISHKGSIKGAAWIYDSYECKYHVINSHVKYVHQLQNLYFALVGKELEIK